MIVQGNQRLGGVAAAVAAIALLLAVAAPAAAAPAKPSCAKPTSWLAGTTNLCKGSVVYNDYVFDDHGADTGQVLTNRIGTLSPTAGDQRYPVGQEATADLIRLTMKPNRKGTKLRVTGLLDALYKRRSTVLGIALDTDNNRKTGGGKWGPLDVSSKGWEKLKLLRRGNVDKNTIRGSIPLPTHRRFRVQAVTAVAEGGQVMNVAFRGPNERSRFGEGDYAGTAVGAWFEDEQAAALADGDITRFGKTVIRRNVTERKTRRAKVSSGYHERVYRSRYTLGPGEGVSYEGIPGRGNGGGGPTLGFEQKFNFRGHYQPYGVYLPKEPGPHGIQVLFHGSAANLASLIGQPGMQKQFGEQQNRILVVPEGRGTEGWGSDISERDQLDVIRDVERSYRVDKNKVFAGGYSQGGYSTYRFASLHPDMFAGATDWVGFTGDSANGAPPGTPHYTAGAVGNGVDLIQNLLHVPTAMLYAGADYLVTANQGMAIDAAFAKTDNVYRYYFHPTAEHLTFAALDDWRKESAYSHGRTLERNPARVVFGTARFLDSPAYDLIHDHAYWVSKLRTRGDRRDYGTVDLTSTGCGGSVAKVASSTGAGPDPVLWKSDDQNVVSRTKLQRQPRLTGTLTGVSSLTIDVKRTCLAGKPISYSIHSDGPATITFSDGRKPLKIQGAGLVRASLAP